MFGQTALPPAAKTGVQAIAAGVGQGLALRQNGVVIAWGRNDSGQANVRSGLLNVKAIAAGGGYSLALLGDGTVKQWGKAMCLYPVPAAAYEIIAISAGWIMH